MLGFLVRRIYKRDAGHLLAVRRSLDLAFGCKLFHLNVCYHIGVIAVAQVRIARGILRSPSGRQNHCAHTDFLVFEFNGFSCLFLGRGLLLRAGAAGFASSSSPASFGLLGGEPFVLFLVQLVDPRSIGSYHTSNIPGAPEMLKTR